MRAHEQFDVEALFERLQPIAEQTRSRIGLAGRKRLNHRLAIRSEGVEFNIEIVLGVNALRHAEPEWRMTCGDVSPGEAKLWRRTGDGWREHPAAERAGRGGEADGSNGFENSAARQRLDLRSLSHRLLLSR